MPPKFESHRTRWDDDIYSKAEIKESYIIRIVVEGAQTETRFFRKCIQKSTRILVVVLPPDENQTGPEKLFEQLKEEIQKDIEQSNRQPADQNWIVCDVDEHPYLNQTIEKISEFNEERQETFPPIQIAISNPCFEVWLTLYKKRNLRGKILEDLCDKALLRELVKDVDPGFTKTNFNIQRFQNHAMAINQSKKLDKHKHKTIPFCPGTRVYQLVEEILKIIEKKY